MSLNNKAEMEAKIKQTVCRKCRQVGTLCSTGDPVQASSDLRRFSVSVLCRDCRFEGTLLILEVALTRTKTTYATGEWR